MGPSCGRRKRNTRRSSSRRKNLFKKGLSKDQDDSTASSPISSSLQEVDVINVEISCDGYNECSTPRGENFRIPDIKTCPPAPKKRRMTTSCSLRKSPIAFFASPDIELFFYFALRGLV